MMDEDKITGWANWAVVGNDAIYPCNVPFVLRELHERIKQAIRQATEAEKVRDAEPDPLRAKLKSLAKRLEQTSQCAHVGAELRKLLEG